MRVRKMSRGNHNNTPPEKIFRKAKNLGEHYMPRKRILPYKSPVVAWTSEKITMKDKYDNVHEGIRLKPLSRRFTVHMNMI